VKELKAAIDAQIFDYCSLSDLKMFQKVKCNVLHPATISILEATKKKQGNLNSNIAPTPTIDKI